MELIYCLIYCSPMFKKSQCWHRILNTFFLLLVETFWNTTFKASVEIICSVKNPDSLKIFSGFQRPILSAAVSPTLHTDAHHHLSHPISPKLCLISALSFLWALSLKNSWGCATLSLKYVSQHTTFHLETLKWAVMLYHSKCSSNKPLSTRRKIKERLMFMHFEMCSLPSSHLTYLLSNQTVWTFMLVSVSVKA